MTFYLPQSSTMISNLWKELFCLSALHAKRGFSPYFASYKAPMLSHAQQQTCRKIQCTTLPIRSHDVFQWFACISPQTTPSRGSFHQFGASRDVLFLPRFTVVRSPQTTTAHPPLTTPKKGEKTHNTVYHTWAWSLLPTVLSPVI